MPKISTLCRLADERLRRTSDGPRPFLTPEIDFHIQCGVPALSVTREAPCMELRVA